MSEIVNKIMTTPEWDALHTFDSENNIEPARAVAERIAWKYGAGERHSLVDDISHAIEDAREIGKRRGPLEEEALKSSGLMPDR